MEGSSPQAKGCRLRPGHRSLLQLRRLGVTAGCKCTVLAVTQCKRWGGAEGAERSSRSCCCHEVTQRTQWRGEHSRYWDPSCANRAVIPHLWVDTLLLHLAPALSSSGFVCCTHLSSHSPHGPFLAGDDRKRQNMTGEKGGLQPTMDPMTQELQLSSVFQERFSLQLTWYLGSTD